MVLISKGRRYTIHEVKATPDGVIKEIEDEISRWNGVNLKIKIERIH